MVGSEPGGKRKQPGFDLRENSLIGGGVLTIGIFNIPFLDPGKRAEDAASWEARHVDDEIRILEECAAEGLGGEVVDGITVSEKCLGSEPLDFAEGIEACARGVDYVGSLLARDGFCHGAAAGVSNADEEDTKFLIGHELSWS